MTDTKFVGQAVGGLVVLSVLFAVMIVAIGGGGYQSLPICFLLILGFFVIIGVVFELLLRFNSYISGLIMDEEVCCEDMPPRKRSEEQ